MGVRKEFLIILIMVLFVAMASVVASDTDNATQEVLSVDTSDDNVSISTVEVDNVERAVMIKQSPLKRRLKIRIILLMIISQALKVLF